MAQGPGKSRANLNKEVRQEAIRNQLAAYGHHTQVVDVIDRIDRLSAGDEGAQFELQKLQAKANLHLRMLNKYLPDLKAVEMTATVDDQRKPVADPYYSADPDKWRKSAGDHNPARNTH